MRYIPQTSTVDYYQSSPPLPPGPSLGSSYFAGDISLLSVGIAGALFWQVGRAMQPSGEKNWGPMAAIAGVVSPALGLGTLALLALYGRR
jgi:hypothetical protein